MRCALALPLSAMILLAACVGSSSDQRTDTTTAVEPVVTEEPTTSTDPTTSVPNTDDDSGDESAAERLEALRLAGADELELALAELSAFLGPIPGVPVIEYDDSLYPSMTSTLNFALASYAEMTDEQIAVIEEALEWMTTPENVIDVAIPNIYLDGDGLDDAGDTEPEGLRRAPVTTVSPFVPDCPPANRVADDRLEQYPDLIRWRGELNSAASRLAAEYPGQMNVVVTFVKPYGSYFDRENGTRVLATTLVRGPAGETNNPAAMSFYENCLGVFDCYITVAEPGLRSQPMDSALTHELFHCWHFKEIGRSLERWKVTPGWLTEGLASWVGEVLNESRSPVSADPLSWGMWWTYFNIPRAVDGSDTGDYDLFEESRGKSHAAIGFWSHIDNHSDLRAAIPLILRTGGSTSDQSVNSRRIYAEAMRTISEMGRRTVASAPTKYDHPDWTTRGPQMPRGARPVTELTVGVDAPAELVATPGVQRARTVNFDFASDNDHAVTVELKHNAIMTWWADDTTASVGDGRTVVVRCVGTCRCPRDDLDQTMLSIERAGAEFGVALSGGPRENSSARITVTELDDCGSRGGILTGCTGSGPGCERPGRGGSFGHPNLVTFDGVGYVFHGAGDYVVAESLDDDFAVHARFSRLGNMTGVSFNRGVAARVGDSIVSFGDDADSTAFDPAVVRVDGRVVDLDDGPVELPAGTVTLRRGNFLVRWADGTELGVGSRVGDSFELELSAARWERTRGLLGDADGDKYNDVVTRSGDVVSPYDFDDFYDRFGSAWLLDEPDTLFESILDPADIAPIVPTAQVTLADLPQDVRDAAEATCREAGVRAGLGLSQCIFDIAMTGDSRWTTGVLAMEETVGRSVSVSSLGQLIEDEVDVTEIGDIDGSLDTPFAADVFSIDLDEGASIDIAATSCSEDTTFEAALLDAAGNVLGRTRGDGCGSMTIDRLPRTGVYRLTVYDTGGFTGAYSFGLTVDLATPDGDDDLDEPFEIGVVDGEGLSFDARAGQVLRFARTGRFEVDDRLMTFEVVGPDGSEIESWLVSLDFDLTIPVDGTFTVFVDTIGQLTTDEVEVAITEVGVIPIIPVSFGAPFEVSFDSASDVVLARFDTEAGDTIVIENSVLGSSASPIFGSFTLRAPDGSEVRQWFTTVAPRIDIPTTGTYVLTHISIDDSPGSFEVTVKRL